MTKLTLSKRQTSKKEPNVLAFGMLQTPQSIRADIVIFEDIISHKYRTSPRIKEKTDKNFEALIPILEKNAKIIYIGTRFHYDDIPAQIKENNKITNKWYIMEKSAENDYGKSAFPHIIDDEELTRLQAELTKSFYASQYLNKPVNYEETLFHIEEYASYSNIPERKGFKIVLAGVDLALSTNDSADERAIVFIGVSESHLIYLLDCYSSKEKIDDFYRSIKMYYNKWNPDRVFVEVNGAFKIVYDKFVENSIKDKSYIPFSEVLNTKNKELRIELTLLPLLKNKILLLPSHKLYRENKYLKKLIDIEMSYFNPTIQNNKDDSLDSLEIVCSKLKEIVFSPNYMIGGELRTSSIDMRIL